MPVLRLRRSLLVLVAALFLFTQSGCCFVQCFLFSSSSSDFDSCVSRCESSPSIASKAKGKQPILVDGTPQVGKKVLAP